MGGQGRAPSTPPFHSHTLTGPKTHVSTLFDSCLGTDGLTDASPKVLVVLYIATYLLWVLFLEMWLFAVQIKPSKFCAAISGKIPRIKPGKVIQINLLGMGGDYTSKENLKLKTVRDISCLTKSSGTVTNCKWWFGRQQAALELGDFGLPSNRELRNSWLRVRNNYWLISLRRRSYSGPSSLVCPRLLSSGHV